MYSRLAILSLLFACTAVLGTVKAQAPPVSDQDAQEDHSDLFGPEPSQELPESTAFAAYAPYGNDCDACGDGYQWQRCTCQGGYCRTLFAPRCNMPQHHPYYTCPQSYYYFRPYNGFHIPPQQAVAASFGEDPRLPYANTLFRNLYNELEIEFGEREGEVPQPPAAPAPTGRRPRPTWPAVVRK